MSRLSRRHVIYAVATPSAVLAFAVGCQILVPGDVPDFTCTGSAPSSCPDGTVCDPLRGACVPPDATEGGKVDGRVPPADGGPDVGPLLSGPGGTCSRDNDCMTGLLCGTQSILTSAILGEGNPVCTRPCCTSADCDSGFVCYATGTGGNYCVSAAKAQRSPPDGGAGATPGASCSLDGDCRSGSCTNQRCLDTCCNDDQCGNGSVCRFATIVGPAVGGGPVTHSGWACAIGNDGGTGASTTCTDNKQCANDNCAYGVFPDKRCSPACCSAVDCAGAGFTNNVCAYGGTGSDQLKWCFEPPASGSPDGTVCNTGPECASNYCDSTLKKCARPCCQTSDCKANESCKPADNPSFLRCVAN